jgi:hypothetical protein
MVIKMLSRDVLPFLAMYSCFFAMTLSWLWGIYAGMDGPATSVWDVCVLLIRYTINPDTSYFTLLGSSAGDDMLFAIAGGVQAVWLVLSNVVRTRCPPRARLHQYTNPLPFQRRALSVHPLEQVLLNALIAMMNTTVRANAQTPTATASNGSRPNKSDLTFSKRSNTRASRCH